jgi:hypothetical protein
MMLLTKFTKFHRVLPKKTVSPSIRAQFKKYLEVGEIALCENALGEI